MGHDSISSEAEMVLPSFADLVRPLRNSLGGQYREWSLARRLAPFPAEALVPIDKSPDVLLLCSRCVHHFDAKTHLQELAFAHELEAAGRSFAVSDEPRSIFDKSVVWFLPDGFISPRLWNHSRQVHDFALGLERQGNSLFCSSAETSYWENKAFMHRRLEELAVPTPRTTIIGADDWQSVEFDMEPVLIKEEHSAGSAGVHYFRTATAARDFVSSYPFRSTESLIMQALVERATRDLRVTMVGDTMIESATFWRTKSAEALSRSDWTTTATVHGSSVAHRDVPPSVVLTVKDYLRSLGLRTAGVDVMWAGDDVSADALVLEVSPFYQPNPPKPARYAHLTYTQYKHRPYADEGYLLEQYRVFRAISREILAQNLY
jgi:glutathione synthase/RimK-type ligase-like ATP-grasp enzyme